VPRHFAGTLAFSESELFVPLNWFGPREFDDRQARGLHAFARLRPQVPIDRAQAAMDVVAERLAREYADSNANTAVKVVPERLARPEEDQSRSNALAAAIMLSLVGLVTIVASVNVTNLVLGGHWSAGTNWRSALRSAPAADASRQMMTESLMLSALGGLAGVLLGTWASRALAAVRLPGDLPVRFDFQLDRRVLAYALAVVSVTGLIVGVVPAIRASRADVDRTLRQSRYGRPGADRHLIRGALVVAQIAPASSCSLRPGCSRAASTPPSVRISGFDPTASSTSTWMSDNRLFQRTGGRSLTMPSGEWLVPASRMRASRSPFRWATSA
jgi:hypothetical protein